MTDYIPQHIRLTRAVREGDHGEQVVHLVTVCLHCSATSEPISGNATLARDEMDSFIDAHHPCPVSAA